MIDGTIGWAIVTLLVGAVSFWCGFRMGRDHAETHVLRQVRDELVDMLKEIKK